MSIGPPERERATVAFRRLLDRANEDEQARVDALLVLGQRTLFAPTWSSEDSGVRTLTNAAGETAMPLFTGDDTLQAAALRFKWPGADGRVNFRELPAREAIRHALAHGVHFVVLDIGSPHSTEFVREELAPLLTVPSSADGYSTDARTTGRLGEAVRRSTRPPRRAGESFPPPPPATAPRAAPTGGGLALGLDAPFAELDSPFKREPPRRESPAPGQRDRRTTTDRMPVVVREERPFAPAAVREERPFAAPAAREERPFAPVAAPVAREERPFAAAPVAREERPFAPPAAREERPFASAPEAPPRREPTTGVARRLDAFPRDDVTQEVPSVPPRPPSDWPEAPRQPPAERAAPKTSLASRIDAALPDLGETDEHALPALAEPAAPRASGVGPFGSFDPASALGESDPDPAFAARPEALEAAAMVTELARSSGDADAREAAAELAEMLKASAAGEKLPGDDKPKPDAASEMAALLLGGTPGGAKPVAAPSPERRTLGATARTASSTAQPAVAAPAAGSPERTSAMHRTVAASPASKAAAAGLRRPEVPLSDELVDQLADKLRGYPEVEWACEASDGGQLPVVGLRVDPSFLSRVAEITEAILSAGKQRGTPLSVVLLTDAEKMKRARNLQTVFFPGRRRGPKK